MSWPLHLGVFALGAILGLAATRLVLGWASRCLLDMPCHRSSHARPTPSGGGLGILLAFAGLVCLIELFAPQTVRPDPLGLLLLAGPLAVVGWLDDRRGLPRLPRYLVQLGSAAGLVLWLGVPLDILGVVPRPLAVVLCIVAVTAIINFTNFLDGMDGFAGGVACVLFLLAGAASGSALWWGLAGTLLGFLLLNWHPARIFMGDVGSTALGLLLCAAFFDPTARPGFDWPLLAAGLPFFGDAIYTICRRVLRRENIFEAHHSHVYQRLMRTGMAHDAVALRYIALVALCGGLGWAFGPSGAGLAAACCLGVLALAEARITSAGVPFTRPRG